ncbi:sugar transferase [Aquihabitans sp. McL0605]|uniref:sugar transferase n=1 Tax=Aquihabitans sp. McL0605 TaxID=3415671 RepID=UPI003CFA4390
MSTGRAGSPSTWARLRSAAVDRIVAGLLLPVLAPVIAVLGWRVRRADGGPPVIGLTRIGRDGAPFTMWKLRSMRSEEADGSSGGAVITAVGDDRITPVGAMMRRWRLDELPQIWNVVRGDMSLLGPRPETPAMVDLDDPAWLEALAVAPGITGPTQLVVERWESERLEEGAPEDVYRTEILPVKLAIDQWYLRSASPAIDLKVAWSMVERFALGRTDTAIQRIVREQVPEARLVPVDLVPDG